MAQEMPPPGGFGHIPIERVQPRIFLKNYWTAGILVVWTIWGCAVAAKKMLELKTLKTEITEHYIAVEPFIAAERERKFLRHLKHQRDFERHLMKDHPGWIVGTLYGERPYKTLPPDGLPPIDSHEFVAHHNHNWWRDWMDPSGDI